MSEVKMTYDFGYGPVAAHHHTNLDGSEGGWVADSANVSADTFVEKTARVVGGTIEGGTIYGGTIYGGRIVDGTIEGGTIYGGTIKGGRIVDGTIYGGTIYGGTIYGGTIEGGTIYGGTIYGGTIYGGTIYGGTIKGGTIKGGTIKGGTIYGGMIYGGTIEDGIIEGGTIKGGTIYGGTIKGGTIKQTPLLIFGTRYWIGFSRPGFITSGCIEKPLEWWLENVVQCAEKHGYTVAQQQEYRVHVEHLAAWMKLYNVDQQEVATNPVGTEAG